MVFKLVEMDISMYFKSVVVGDKEKTTTKEKKTKEIVTPSHTHMHTHTLVLVASFCLFFFPFCLFLKYLHTFCHCLLAPTIYLSIYLASPLITFPPRTDALAAEELRELHHAERRVEASRSPQHRGRRRRWWHPCGPLVLLPFFF